MAAAPPGYRPDIRPGNPGDRPHDEPHPPQMPRVQDAIPSLDCRARKRRSNPFFLTALRFAPESRGCFLTGVTPAWIQERSATGLRKADLNVLSKLGNQGLEWRLESEAFTGDEVGREDDLLDFPVGCLVDIKVARQPPKPG